MQNWNVSNKWKRIVPLYRLFAADWNECCDFSREAAEAFYEYESRGGTPVLYSAKQPNGLYNGYAVGKHWLDVTVAMWLEDLTLGEERPLLTKAELLEDPALADHHPWLKRILCIGPDDDYR